MLVDTSGDASELPRSSLDYLSSFVAAALQDAQHLGEIKRLKVTGKWISKTEETLRARASSHTRSESGASDSDTKLREPNGAVKEDWEIKTEKEWARGIKTLRKLVEKLPNLENLE